jgi:hypothetical protein
MDAGELLLGAGYLFRRHADQHPLNRNGTAWGIPCGRSFNRQDGRSFTREDSTPRDGQPPSIATLPQRPGAHRQAPA